MILIDANILIYAVHEGCAEHAQARQWLDDRLHGPARVGLPWNSLLAFLRITSNARIFPSPLSVAQGWRQIERWLSSKIAWCPSPTTQHAEILGTLVRSTTLEANDIPDAHLAALAIEHGLILCSTDSDFSKYAGLRWENPLKTPA